MHTTQTNIKHKRTRYNKQNTHITNNTIVIQKKHIYTSHKTQSKIHNNTKHNQKYITTHNNTYKNKTTQKHTNKTYYS